MTDAERDAIERACEKICIAYARHIDFAEYDAFVDLFVEDGVLEVFGQKLVGHAGLRKFTDARPVNRKALHVLSNVWVNVIDANRAEGKSYVTVFRADPTGDGPVSDTTPFMAGYMDDVYVRTPKGWKFSFRKANALFMKS